MVQRETKCASKALSVVLTAELESVSMDCSHCQRRYRLCALSLHSRILPWHFLLPAAPSLVCFCEARAGGLNLSLIILISTITTSCSPSPAFSVSHTSLQASRGRTPVGCLCPPGSSSTLIAGRMAVRLILAITLLSYPCCGPTNCV